MTLLFSTGILLVTFLLVQCVRIVTRRILPPTAYQFIAEFLCTFQITACVYENGMLLANYGMAVFAAALFCLVIGYSLTFDAYGNPAATLEQVIKGQIGVLNGILRMASQVAGGLLAYRCIVHVWGVFAPTASHAARAGLLDNSCESSLQVDLVTGVTTEALAMFVSRSVAGVGLGGPNYYRIVNAFTTMVVVVSGLEWTGMLFNPALATALTYNCKGHRLFEHIAVYWIGPFIGTILSILAFRYVMEEQVHDLSAQHPKGVIPMYRNGVETNKDKRT